MTTMMSVDEALEWSDSLDSDDRDHAEIEALAVEVRRLREALEWQAATTKWLMPYQDETVRLTAKLARVEALPAKWRAEIDLDGWSAYASELDAALAGEP